MKMNPNQPCSAVFVFADGLAETHNIADVDIPINWMEQLESLEIALANRAHPYRVPTEAADPVLRVARGFHCLHAVYATKALTMCRMLRRCFREDDYFTYALIGRSIIEHLAILIYYGRNKIEPLMQAGMGLHKMDPGDLETLGDLLDRFLDGRRFEWNALVQSHLPYTAARRISAPSQVNILTCLEAWSRVSPDVMDFYALFCDMVHPNAGSLIPLLHVDESTVLIGGGSDRNMGRVVAHHTGKRLLEMLSSIPDALDKIKAAAESADLSGRPDETTGSM